MYLSYYYSILVYGWLATAVTTPTLVRQITPAAVSPFDIIITFSHHRSLGEYGFCGDGYVSLTRIALTPC